MEDNIKDKLELDFLITEEVFKIQRSLNTILRLTNHTDLELYVGNKEQSDKMNSLYEKAIDTICEIINPQKD